MSVSLGLTGADAQPSWFTALASDLRPYPGRLADTVRLVVLVVATVAISETFRMPEVAVSAYVVMFVSRNERSSTVMTALVAGVAVVFAAFATIVVFMATLSEPALRVPAIAAATFAGVFFARVSPLGPAAFAAGFIMAYGLTVGDQVLALSLQSSEVSNVTGTGAPALLFNPPEEALLQFLLWLVPVIALPVFLVVVGNLLTGRRPVLLLRDGLADRLAACSAFCADAPGASQALTASARQGSAGFAKLHHFAGTSQQAPDYAGLISETERLALALLTWPMISTREQQFRALAPCAEALNSAERSLRGNSQVVADAPMPAAVTDAERLLAQEIARSSAAIFHALNTAPARQAKTATPVHHLISAEACRSPDTLRFALKVTLAVMLAYAAESLLDWPAIHTCVVTCFFVSLGTIGESVHKATLRVVGALIGGALGIASILLLMPLMTDLGDLLLCVAAVTFLAGWVATGPDRISYAGWQIGMANYLTLLQGYGPTLDMQTARDRVIGIILGNLIVLLVFTTVWPISVSLALRRQVANAIGAFAALMRLPAGSVSESQRAQAGFAAATIAARGLMAHAGYERIVPGRRAAGHIDIGTLVQLESIMLVLRVILDEQPDSTLHAPMPQEASAYHHQMASWFERCAAWVGTGGDGSSLEAAIPPPPRLDAPALAGRAAWYGVLDQKLRQIMSHIMHRAVADA